MDLLYNSLFSAEIPELISDYARNYEQPILVVLLVISLLNCFFGFHLRKLWGTLAGMFIGAALSFAICIYLNKTSAIMYIVTLLGAFTVGLLGLLLYHAGLFFIGTLLVPLLLSRIFTVPKLETLFLWILLGIIASTLTLIWERETISTITAVAGGFGATICLMRFQHHFSYVMIIMVGTTLSLAGLLLQFQPWRSRSSWNSDEERARDKHRHKRRMKRIKKKKRNQERMEQKQNGNHSRKHRTAKNRETTEYTPYTTHPIYQASLREKQKLQNSQEHSTDTQSDSSHTTAPPSGEQSYVNPDLSDIRQLISKEVSGIYLEKQQEMDKALDQLLEKEYQSTARHKKRRK